MGERKMIKVLRKLYQATKKSLNVFDILYDVLDHLEDDPEWEDLRTHIDFDEFLSGETMVFSDPINLDKVKRVEELVYHKTWRHYYQKNRIHLDKLRPTVQNLHETVLFILGREKDIGWPLLFRIFNSSLEQKDEECLKLVVDLFKKLASQKSVTQKTIFYFANRNEEIAEFVFEKIRDPMILLHHGPSYSWEDISMNSYTEASPLLDKYIIRDIYSDVQWFSQETTMNFFTRTHSKKGKAVIVNSSAPEEKEPSGSEDDPDVYNYQYEIDQDFTELFDLMVAEGVNINPDFIDPVVLRQMAMGEYSGDKPGSSDYEDEREKRNGPEDYEDFEEDDQESVECAEDDEDLYDESSQERMNLIRLQNAFPENHLSVFYKIRTVEDLTIMFFSLPSYYLSENFRLFVEKKYPKMYDLFVLLRFIHSLEELLKQYIWKHIFYCPDTITYLSSTEALRSNRVVERKKPLLEAENSTYIRCGRDFSPREHYSYNNFIDGIYERKMKYIKWEEVEPPVQQNVGFYASYETGSM